MIRVKQYSWIKNSSLGDSPSATPHRNRSGTQWQRWYARCAGLALLRCIMTLTREDGRAPSHQCVTVPNCCTDALIGLACATTDNVPTHRVDANGRERSLAGKAPDRMFTVRRPEPCSATQRRPKGSHPGQLGAQGTRCSEALGEQRRSWARSRTGVEAGRKQSHATLPRLWRRRWESARVCVAGQRSELGSWHGFAVPKGRPRARAESPRFAFGLGKMPRGQMGETEGQARRHCRCALVPGGHRVGPWPRSAGQRQFPHAVSTAKSLGAFPPRAAGHRSSARLRLSKSRNVQSLPLTASPLPSSCSPPPKMASRWTTSPNLYLPHIHAPTQRSNAPRTLVLLRSVRWPQ